MQVEAAKYMSVDVVPGTEKSRVVWADILKGLGILAVVWGHSGSKNAFYMFWFHMPLFFFISGYLYHYNPQQSEFFYIRKKAKHILVPYVFYLCLITSAMVLVDLWRGQPVGTFFAANWKALILGGSLLEGVYATFWFATCLFIVQVAYDSLTRKVSSLFFQGAIITGCFFLAYWESRYHQRVFVPWNLDVGLYAVVFYALGQIFRRKSLLENKSFRKAVTGASLVLLAGFLYLYSHHFLDYGLDMKHRQYYYFGSNIIVPLILTLLLIQISICLSKLTVISKALIGLGQASMVIMYLHLLAVSLARHFFVITPIRFFVVGIAAPLIFYWLVKQIPLGRSLALGESAFGKEMTYRRGQNWSKSS